MKKENWFNFLKKHIVILVPILVLIISPFLYGFPSIVLFLDGPLAELLVFLEKITNCKDYCLLFEIILASLINALVIFVILFLIMKKKK